MSNTQTTRRLRLPWMGGGAVLAAGLAAVTIAVWPASETDKAHDDGEQVGQAAAHLYEADTQAELDAALVELEEAATDTREHAGDEVAEQVDEQADALNRAVDSYEGAVTTDDDFEAELYELELEDAMDDLAEQASDFRAQGPEVQQAFWEGYEQGFEDEVAES